jgi:prolyl oligopeptidase
LTDLGASPKVASMPHRSILVALIGLTALACRTPSKAVDAPEPPTEPRALPPATELRPVTDTYHGTTVEDPYRWLEEGDAPEVRAWSDAQDRSARSYLNRLPTLEAVRARVETILRAPTESYGSVELRGGRAFALKREPPKQQRFLVVMDSVDAADSARVLVDPSAVDPEGLTSIDWYRASPDGRLVAVSMSRSGSESGDLHLFEVDSGRNLGRTIARVNGGTAGGDLAWLPDSSGFYYTRYPRDGERPPEEALFHVRVYFHALGSDPDQDRYELGEGFPAIAEIQLDLDDATGRLLATVQNGDGGEFAHHLREPDGRWRSFSEFGDRIVQAAFGPDDTLYLISLREAPRGRLLRLSATSLDVASAHEVLPEQQDTLVSAFWEPRNIVITDDRLYLQYQLGGPSEIRAFHLDGTPAAAPSQQAVSSVGGLTELPGGGLLFRAGSYTEASSMYRFDPSTGETAVTSLRTTPVVDLSAVRVEREFATSKDGTRVPVNILLPPGTGPGGDHPCLATGYGGYGISLSPWLRTTDAVLLERGVIVAVANLRGGGEFGEEWHRQGNLLNKQNVFDDFAAVLDHLVERGYTSPQRLVIRGGSNGGLLMGATLVQRPDRIRAAVSAVGIYDMLRVELSPNGRFNITEFGTVTDPAQFRALFAYSPYHNVQDGTAYPPILFTTGANDPRVDPMQSRKMTARLQAATSSEAPILLRTSATTGHGGSTRLDERVEELAHRQAFILHQLGNPGAAPADAAH